MHFFFLHSNMDIGFKAFELSLRKRERGFENVQTSVDGIDPWNGSGVNLCRLEHVECPVEGAAPSPRLG